MNVIQQTPRESRLLRDLLSLLPCIRRKLEEHSRWSACSAHDDTADHTSARLECRDSLVTGDGAYAVCCHWFARAGQRTAMHDHRYPFALLPMATDASRGNLLYRMPWEWRDGGRICDAGTIDVCAGRPYAVEAPGQLFHAVHSVTPHLSLAIADTSAPPLRDSRLIRTALDESATTSLRLASIAALDATLRAPSSGRAYGTMRPPTLR